MNQSLMSHYFCQTGPIWALEIPTSPTTMAFSQSPEQAPVPPGPQGAHSQGRARPSLWCPCNSPALRDRPWRHEGHPSAVNDTISQDCKILDDKGCRDSPESPGASSTVLSNNEPPRGTTSNCCLSAGLYFIETSKCVKVQKYSVEQRTEGLKVTLSKIQKQK